MSLVHVLLARSRPAEIIFKFASFPPTINGAVLPMAELVDLPSPTNSEAAAMPSERLKQKVLSLSQQCESELRVRPRAATSVVTRQNEPRARPPQTQLAPVRRIAAVM